MADNDRDSVITTEDLPLPDLSDLVPAKPSEIVPIEPTPVSLLAQALDQGLDHETLGRFMDLQERYEAGEARKAYAEAMAACQAEMQPIVAQAENDHTKSLYAKLGVINQQIAPIYGKHGFSISFGNGEARVEGEIRTTARVLHRMGHFEEEYIDLPPDGAGVQGNANKTPIHARASSMTYGRRYIVMGIFNLSILTEDDDGNLAGGSDRISEEQILELAELIAKSGLLAKALLTEAGVDDWAKLPVKKFEKVKNRIAELAAKRGSGQA